MSQIQKPKKFDTNLIVIGAGAAGLVSAYIAAAIKAKVTLIESHKMGGDCLNTGCVPSKALVKIAKLKHEMETASRFGLTVPKPEVDFPAVMAAVKKAIIDIEPHDSVERYESLGVDCIQGKAQLTSPYSVKVNDQTLTAPNIILATGAEPRVPPIDGIDQVDYHTSDTIWSLEKLPKKMVLMGGGPIGCELAQCFARLGTEVTVVEMGSRLLANEDPSVSDLIKSRFVRENIRLLLGYKAVSARQEGDEKILVCQAGDREEEVRGDVLMVAIGRQARVDGFGLDTLGIKLAKGGTIDSNPFLQTSQPNIYVCGDATGPFQFTHMAAHQAWYAVVNALFGRVKKFKVDYRVVPRVTFTDPEVASVGETAAQLNARGVDYDITLYSMSELDRAIAEGQTDGFIQILTEKGKDKILGATICGHHAGELLAEMVLAMKHGLGLNKVLGTIHAYPTWCEANKYVAGNWKKANKPDWLLDMMGKGFSFFR